MTLVMLGSTDAIRESLKGDDQMRFTALTLIKSDKTLDELLSESDKQVLITLNDIHTNLKPGNQYGVGVSSQLFQTTVTVTHELNNEWDSRLFVRQNHILTADSEKEMCDKFNQHITAYFEALKNPPVVEEETEAPTEPPEKKEPELIVLNITATTVEEESPAARKERVCKLIEQVCQEMGFEEVALIKAMVECESGFDTNQISSKNARGLMQITPRWFGAEMATFGVTDLNADEAGNLRIGIRFINKLINKYGDYSKALVAYNAGESEVDIDGVYHNSYSGKVLKVAGEYLNGSR